MPTFEECIQLVLKQILLSPEDRQIYNHDAEIIRNEIIERMKTKSLEFKEAYDGLSLTGSYLDNLKIDLPEEFDMDMKLKKMPFNLTPIADPQRPGFVNLIADVHDHRFIGRKGKLCRMPLQWWLRTLFLKTIGTGFHLTVDNRKYMITYPKCGRGQGVAHTVKAKQVGGKEREIAFDFVPAFEFPAHAWPFDECEFQSDDQSWFAIPFGKKVRTTKERSNKYTFKVSAPHWEREALHDKQNLKNSLRLMKALRDANGLKELASYTLKSVYLEEIDKHQIEFWEQDPGEILIEMLSRLLDYLNKGCLPFFLHRGVNQLNSLPRKCIPKYQTVIAEILSKLVAYRDEDDIELKKVMAIFVH